MKLEVKAGFGKPTLIGTYPPPPPKKKGETIKQNGDDAHFETINQNHASNPS